MAAMVSLTVAAAMALALSGCGSGAQPSASHDATKVRPPSSPATPGSLEGDFDVGGGRHLHVRCAGTGEPTVVLEVGDDDTPGGSWGAVYTPLTGITRTCGYDRANLGQSDPDPGPNTVKDLGDDLVTLLHVAKVPGPYVFVGGSFGGDIVGVLAANHPDEVAGLVYVDSDPPNNNPALDPFRRNLPAKVYAKCCAPGLFEPPFDSPENSEHVDWKASHPTELDSMSHLPKVPTIVLTAAQPECQTGWPCAAIARDEKRLQALWIKGNPRGSQRVVDSGHVMQREAPQAIIDATKEIVAALPGR
jgi:pimeloyl-ACP methyl ester carboxylesterase